jgi:hypothetical protein
MSRYTSSLSVSLTVCCAAAVALAGSAPAWAQPKVDQQVNAIYKAWTDGNTTQNRALSKQRGGALEATSGFAPAFKRQRTILSKLPSIPHFRFQDATGVASLAITSEGLGIRKYKGHKGMRYHYSSKPGMIGVVSRDNKVTTGKVKPLVPRFMSRAFPKLSQRVGTWRAKRLIRKAVRAGTAPTPRQVTRALR